MSLPFVPPLNLKRGKEEGYSRGILSTPKPKTMFFLIFKKCYNINIASEQEIVKVLHHEK
jgi:hypothetical protein